jgi:drug/metabolite transporter (DMT)-like permease
VRKQPETKEHAVIVKTVVASVVVVATNVVGNYALSRGMHEVGELLSWSPMAYIHTFTHPWVAVGVVFMVGWLASRLALLSWADLSYVVPVTSFSYVLSAIVAQVYLREHVSALRWAGISVITLGVVLVALTYPETPELYHEAPIENEPRREA